MPINLLFHHYIIVWQGGKCNGETPEEAPPNRTGGAFETGYRLFEIGDGRGKQAHVVLAGNVPVEIGADAFAVSHLAQHAPVGG